MPSGKRWLTASRRILTNTSGMSLRDSSGLVVRLAMRLFLTNTSSQHKTAPRHQPRPNQWAHKKFLNKLGQIKMNLKMSLRRKETNRPMGSLLKRMDSLEKRANQRLSRVRRGQRLVPSQERAIRRRKVTRRKMDLGRTQVLSHRRVSRPRMGRRRTLLVQDRSLVMMALNQLVTPSQRIRINNQLILNRLEMPNHSLETRPSQIQLVKTTPVNLTPLISHQ